jgi:hypothetical protein
VKIQPDPEEQTLKALACAVVVHQTPYRIRIKIPEWERCDANFAELQGKLEACPGITHVHVNPLVAGIIIHCSEGFRIASAHHCFTGLSLVVPASVAVVPSQWAWPIGTPGLIGHHSALSGQLVGLAFDLIIAVWTGRLKRPIIEWVLQAAVPMLLRLLCRYPTPPRLAPQRLLAAAAG